MPTILELKVVWSTMDLVSFSITRHDRANFANFAFGQFGISKGEYNIRSSRPSYIRKERWTIQRVVQVFKECINPFDDCDKAKRFYISSGAPASQNLADDLLQARAIGKSTHEEFVQQLFVENKVKFDDVIPKNKLKTFAQNNIKLNQSSASVKGGGARHFRFSCFLTSKLRHTSIFHSNYLYKGLK